VPTALQQRFNGKPSWPHLALVGVLLAGFLLLLVPTVLTLFRQVWQTDEQGHGPIIGAVSLWLMWRQRQAVIDAPVRPVYVGGGLLFVLSMVLYALGRSQQIIQGEVVGLIGATVALLLLMRGVQGLRAVAFPLLFLVFLVPLPGVLVQAITIPLKTAVSYVAEWLMYHAGYPIARTGVILAVGPYQLLVADACAGLNSLFTLEALGLLYLNLMGYTSKMRNLVLAILVVPISFIANVVRVIILILVTYHFGDEAGQGFVHTFAGMVLFGLGLAMMLVTDGVVGRMMGQGHGVRGQPDPDAAAGAAAAAPTASMGAGLQSALGRLALPMPTVLACAGLMLAAAWVGEWMRPSYRLSEHKPRVSLAAQVPEAFGEWRLDKSMAPVVPDPNLQAMLDELYSQTLARTYINAKGQRIMLSIAYGSDQGNEATAVHRPEFCYSAQGFRVEVLGKEAIRLGETQVPVARLVARMGQQRIEPITYWVTLDEVATLPGLGRKLQQISYGLRGQIPDGMLVRVSSISPSTVDSFALQQRFLDQLYAVVPADMRARYFGAQPPH
jgi:exosortase B